MRLVLERERVGLGKCERWKREMRYFQFIWEEKENKIIYIYIYQNTNTTKINLIFKKLLITVAKKL